MVTAVFYSRNKQREESTERQIRKYEEYVVQNWITETDQAKSAVVAGTFTNYADSGTITEIAVSLNTYGLLKSQDNEFAGNHRHTYPGIRRYPGKHEYCDTGVKYVLMPMILPELFEPTQNLSASNLRKESDEPFILAEKIFCGHCGTPMTGESIADRNGKYHYYTCSDNTHVKRCRKMTVHKQTIEDIVINSITALLFNEKRLPEITDIIMKMQAISRAETLLSQRDFGGSEICLHDLLQQKYDESEKRESEQEIRIMTEQFHEKKLSRDEALCWFERFWSIDTSDIKQREMIIYIFVNAVYVFDDHIVIVHNFKEKARRTEVAEVTCHLGLVSDTDCYCLPNRYIQSAA